MCVCVCIHVRLYACVCVCIQLSNSIHFIRVEVHGGGSIYTCTHVHQLHYFYSMHVHKNDQMTTTEQDIVGPGELYIVYALLVLYIPSTYLPSPLQH